MWSLNQKRPFEFSNVHQVVLGLLVESASLHKKHRAKNKLIETRTINENIHNIFILRTLKNQRSCSKFPTKA